MIPKRPTGEDHAIAVRISTMRKARGLSQTQVADAIGVTFQQVQKYEKGINRIGPDRLSKLCALFQVPISTFFDETAGGGDAKSELFALLKPRGAVELLRAYAGIESPELQRDVLALIKTTTKLITRSTATASQ